MIDSLLIDNLENQPETTPSAHWILPTKRAKMRKTTSSVTTRRAIELLHEQLAFKNQFGCDLEA